MDAPIVVGFDGSRTAGSALAWAADDARRRDLPLRVVHVHEPWAAEHAFGVSASRRTSTEECHRMLADAAERARELAPRTEVSTAVVTGAVVERLRTESETADTVVVGSRGHGGFAGLVLGSVGLGLTGSAQSPVVVVRTPPRVPVGEIVVGYDGSPCADLAVKYALIQARAREARVRVLHGRRYPVMAPHPVGFGPLPLDDTAEVRQRLLIWREKATDVEMVEQIVDLHPVPALAAASRTADLAVVGSRGLGALNSTMLGSVSHGILHRAHCPVAVVSTLRSAP
ncbi:universal stress protein [Nonomuraea maritima]|uniref:universal stress protein n=1 Tax=Nonomuraea maritima TaxID=683260 RepID=UPI003713396C